MPDHLEHFLSQWRERNAPHLTPEALAELESHLRERIAQLVAAGHPEADACQQAATELGSSEALGAEFRKLDAVSWLPAKIVTWASGLLLLVAAVLLVQIVKRPGGGVLLAVHVFTVTVGYTTTLLLGFLGACFVLQRARSDDFSPRLLASLSRVTLLFAIVGTVCTAIGIVLSMMWAQREWGRAWGWDAKEIGGLAVIVWMSGFLIAHAFRWVTARGLLVASVLGSNVVLLAWFGGNMAEGLHAYGALPSTAWMLLLVGVVVANLLITFLGLAPAGYLRAQKE